MASDGAVCGALGGKNKIGGAGISPLQNVRDALLGRADCSRKGGLIPIKEFQCEYEKRVAHSRRLQVSCIFYKNFVSLRKQKFCSLPI